jgi:DNA repair protein RecO (recombination protein O)
MPLRETEAIVLRTFRLGEADKIVSLFTRQFGRLRAVASGAQRTRTRFGGTLEGLSYIRLWLFERENRDLVRLNSTELVESFFDMQKEYRMQVAGQFLAEVCERFLPERDVNERAFRLLLAVLRGMKATGSPDRPLVYFDFWFLRLAGFLPDLEACADCGKVLGAEAAYYGGSGEGLVCEACRSSLTGRRVSAAALSVARGLRGLAPEQWMAGKNSESALKEARSFLEDLIEAHGERKLITRQLLAEEF